MTEPELRSILKTIDDALDVYRNHTGPFTAGEISVKSMLMVVREQLSGQLKRQFSDVQGS